MNGTCFECKFMRNRTDLEPCEHCTNTFAMTGVHPSFTPKKPPLTNADRIRAMTDEELADWLGVYCNGQTAQEVGKPCVSDMGSCEECWLDWLKQEAKDDSHG